MAIQDLRGFLRLLDEHGELTRVSAEVDWNLELAAISRRAMDLRSPALLFERLKGYPPGAGRVLANIFGRTRETSHGRFALALGLPKETPVMDVVREFGRRSRRRIPPRVVSTGPCKENILKGAEADILRLPVPMIHGGDGGRYVATWHLDVTKEPDSGLVNWGMYRHVVHAPDLLGWYVSPAQHAGSAYYHKHEPRGERMPIAIAIGTEPISSVIAGSPVPTGVSEPDVVGGILGEPVELVQCETVDLQVPATAEIVIEAEIPPGRRVTEGPFGEFTGYMAAEQAERPVLEIKCITHRTNPILTISNIGKPWEEESVMGSAAWSAMLEEALRAQGLPFKDVYVAPPLQAIIVSVKPPYPGYLHTLASAIWASKFGIYRAYIFFVGEDVDVTDMEDVFWCLTTRLHPANGIHVQTNTPALTLWPWLSSEERRQSRGAKVYFDATFPVGWGKDTPRPIDFRQGWPEAIQKLVLDRWKDYGIGYK